MADTQVRERGQSQVRRVSSSRSVGAISREIDPLWLWSFGVALLCHLVWYGMDAVQGGFRNLDVAGIAYNARLLLDGLLPYVDSWEPKPPGSFFLFAAILSFGSMHAVWIVAIVWGVATSLSLGLLAGRLWGRRFVLPAAALHAGGALLPAQADINYVFWATLPMVLSAAMAFKAPEQVKRPWLHWTLVGAVAALAVLIKQSTVGLIVVLPLAVYWRAGEALSDRLRAIAFGTVGAALVFLALSLPWLLAGEPGALLVGLGLGGGWWVDYSAAQAEVMGSVPAALGGGIVYVIETIQIGSVAALLGLLGFPRRNPGRGDGAPRWAYLVAVVFLLASFAGMAATLRFYLHYLAQLWPAMVLIALNPWGGFVRLLDWFATFGVRRGLACLLLGVCGTLLRVDRVTLRVSRTWNNQVVEALCAAVRPHLAPDDAVLGWGWPSWGVYTHCDRRAPGPIYKAMTIVTTPNTNTGWKRSEPMVLRPGLAADRYVSDFLANPPALVLWSSGYARDGTEPLAELPAITTALDASYRGVELERGYVVFLRNDLYDAVSASAPGFDATVDFDTVLTKWGLAGPKPAAAGQGLPRSIDSGPLDGEGD